MEWDDKVKMIQFSNSGYKEEFQKIVLEHLDDFDNQDWDMFISAFELLPSEMEKSREFCEAVYRKTKDIGYDKFGFRSAIRLSLFNTTCEEVLKF